MAFRAAEEMGMMIAASTVSRMRWRVVEAAAGWSFSTRRVSCERGGESEGGTHGGYGWRRGGRVCHQRRPLAAGGTHGRLRESRYDGFERRLRVVRAFVAITNDGYAFGLSWP